MRKLLGLMFLPLMASVCAPAQQLDFKQAATADPAELAESMPALARAVIAAYHDDDRGKYLDNLFRLQIAACSSRSPSTRTPSRRSTTARART
jgi:hypothetical protein